MYQGNNPSALRSREWIAAAMARLLEREPYGQITVKNICREADLSRQTFYQIFDSKDEVMSYQFGIMFADFCRQCADTERMTVRGLARAFFAFFGEHDAFVSALIDNNMTHLLQAQFERFLPQIPLFQETNERESHPDYAVSFVAAALSQLLIHWFSMGKDMSVEEMGLLTERLLTGGCFVATSDVCE